MTKRGDPFLEPLLVELERDGVAYRLLPPEDAEHRAAQERWERAFPVASWGRVDWEKVPGSTRLAVHDYDAAGERVRELLAGAARPGEPVWVMWSNALRPMLRLPAAAVAKHAALVVEVDWDTWIFDGEPAWCIEHYHEDELCFGRAPAPPRGTPGGREEEGG
ncbi:MAG TPA: hypothetical protein VF746_25915 [Longimicrobium sp.]|jgi:hypothetical protein